MADKRISQLIERTDIANNDVLPIVASGATTTNKVTISTIQEWMQDNLDVGVTSVGITVGTSGTDVNVTGSPITTSGNITINIPTASATNRGLLSAADWSTFTNDRVPYTGATGAVNLGTHAFAAAQININGNAPTSGSYLGFKHSTNVLSGADGYTSMYTFGTNTIAFKSVSGATTKDFSFSMVGITAGVPGGRQYTLPDASGTLALTSDIPSLTGYVTLATDQTITGNKTFNSGTLRVPSGGLGGLPSRFANAPVFSIALSGFNTIGFNGSNNLFITRETDTNGVVLAFDNTAVRTYTLQDASGTLAFTSDISGYVTLGTAQTITATKTFTTSGSGNTININHTSGSGHGLEINKAGNGEGLRVIKTSGSGNAVTISGGLLSAEAATLTGALNGTSASFTGNVSITKDNPKLILNDNSGGSQNNYSISSNFGFFNLNDETASGASVMSYGGGLFNFTGAATFSSSVTATTGLTVGSLGSGSNAIITLANNASGSPRTIYYKASDATINFTGTGGSDQVTITNGGNVGIGTASPTAKLDVRTGAAGTLVNFTDGVAQTFQVSTTSTGIDISNPNSGYISFSNTTERMRITSGGYTKSTSTGSYFGISGSFHELTSNSVNSAVQVINHTASSGAYGIYVKFSSSPNNNGNNFIECADGTEQKFIVYSTGNVVNRNNSYGAISDEKLKENVEDATPKLDDLMKVKVRNYNLIGSDKKQIGVIAQELEEVFPAMIDELEDFEEVEVPQVDEEGNDILNEEGEVQTTKEKVSTGTTTKSVKYSVFVPMLIKAIQEQQEQIKELRAEIEALKLK
jgi:hypothetical protein